MEFIEGESLDPKIERGPLSLKEALGFARQVADGLAAAHAKGVVHRDIKPGNLLVTPEGRVKILDFGLALLTEGSKLTKLDTTVGTVAYMSPEQAQGIEVDSRTDIWALGCVTYEMVRGQRPFQGVYDQALVYEIVNQEPEPLTGVRTGVPMELEWIVGKCLAKDREDRYGRAEDMMLDLRTLAEKLKSGGSAILRTAAGLADAVGTGTLAGPSPRSGDGQAESLSLPRGADVQPILSGVAGRGWKPHLPWALFAVTVAALFAVSFVHFRETPPEAPLRRFAFTPPEAVGATAFSTNVAISPNGKHIAFITAGAEGKLWVQDLDQPQPRAIDGTEGARTPFWSPDSDFIGFAAGGELKKVSVQGSLAIRVCELPGTFFRGGTWSPDGEVIVFVSGPPSVLYEVPGRGGTPNLLISPEESEGSPGGPAGGIYWPHFLPSEAGARVLVFSFGSLTSGHTMMVQNLETGQKELLGPGTVPFYSPSGHIVYQSAPLTHDLWALPFSLDTLKAIGEAFPISENSRSPTVAADQTLVYLGSYGSGQRQLVWLDRGGEKTGEIGEAQEGVGDPALSPDGRLVAITATEGSNQDVWVYDIARGVRTRLSTDPEADWRPVWSPAGEHVAFSSNRAGNWEIFLRQADGSGEEQVLAATPRTELLSDWSRDGKYLLYQLHPEIGADLWYLESNEDGSGWEPHPLLQTPFRETVPRFSPDGRYVAYVSNESGQFEVYVQPFPEGGRKVTVSNNGGRKVRWSRDGRELFYVEGQTLVAVSVSSGSSFSVGSATRLFEHPGLRPGFNYAPYDVSADGQRFILAEPVGEGADAPEPSIRVVQNWFAGFRDREQD